MNTIKNALLAGMVGSLVALPVSAGVISEELQTAMDGLAVGEELAVIVRCKDPLDPGQYRSLAGDQRGEQLIRDFRRQNAACLQSLRQPLAQAAAPAPEMLWIINGLALELPSAAIKQLAVQPPVAGISLDRQFRLPQPVLAGSAATGASPEWNVVAIRAPELWALGIDGAGMVIASLDTGVDPDHPDIGPGWRGGSNSWYDPNGEHPEAPYDSDGHGTWSMGLMVGGDNSGSAIGVAPAASWIAAKIFRDNGRAQLSRIHMAFQWLLDPDGDPASPDAPDVVNNSWYLEQTVDQCNNEFAADIAALRALEIAVVFPAGNTGPMAGSSVSPSNNQGSLATAATDAAGNIASFSGHGPSACGGSLYPQLAAPGVGLLTADLTLGGIIPDAYTYVTGTSFATPQVAAGLALLKSAVAGASLAQLETALTETSLDLDVAGPDSASGYGLPDLVEAHTWLLDNAQTPGAGQIQFAKAEYAVSESAGTVALQVNRSNGSVGEVSLIYATADGTALAGQDYVGTAGTLTFADGQFTASISVQLLDDSLAEADETLEVMLELPSGGAVLGFPATAMVTLLDDDPAPLPGSFSFATDNQRVLENTGSLSVTVLRSGGSDGAVSVAYASADGSALAGEDYSPVAGTLAFADGQTSASFSLAVIDNSIQEGSETMFVQLSGPTGGATLGSPAGFTLIIDDDDTGTPGDTDGDGYAVPADCNDSNASIHPGATEIIGDGIDQDCNGYDLSIVIVSAIYSSKNDQLSVEASSDLGEAAMLEVVSYGAMKWNRRSSRWELSLRRAGGNPGTITVSGPEGAVTTAVAVQ